ncbi:MAG: helix-turn-helix transcriptional regulator [Lachnospiraceae bacterium]|nr:helix-turn-helix transcriptional regulator [Lachnospiraceae bacterium]
MTNSIGNQIKILRKAKGVTQEEMGATLGISYQAVSKWENSTALPDVQMIRKLQIISESHSCGNRGCA